MGRSIRSYISEYKQMVFFLFLKYLSWNSLWNTSFCETRLSQIIYVRTCSVAVPGTSRNNNSENREITGDRPSDDLYPEVGYSSHYFGQLNSPEAESYPHMVTRVQEEICNRLHVVTETREEIPYCSLGTSSGKQKRARSTNSLQFRSENTLRQLKQTRICWPFNNWRRTVIQPISTTISVEVRNCLNPLQQQCPLLMENQKSLNCL